MKQIRSYGDQREIGFCAFCGGKTGTRDHCPSKILLDQPYPDNLPVVPACVECNNSFSADEEYMACLMACVLSGSTDPDLIMRKRIARILRKKGSLRARIQNSIIKENNEIIFTPETERIQNVITKLAKGHSLFELHLPVYIKPDSVSLFPLCALDEKTRFEFEAQPESSLFPEVGSRAMTRLFTGIDINDHGWIVVQPGVYRYLASQNSGVEIRIVINEYLAGIISWPDVIC